MVSIRVLNLASGREKTFAVGANEDEEEATNNFNRNEMREKGDARNYRRQRAKN